MAKQLSPERVIRLVWFTVALTLCWPLPSTSSKNRVYAYKVLQVAAALSATSILLCSLYSAYANIDDFIIVFRSIVVACGMTQITVTTFMCTFKYETLQFLIEDMEVYIKEAQQNERDIFCKYIERSRTFYKTCTIICYMTATIFWFGPVALPISLPFGIDYPFSINDSVVYVSLYFHQTVITYQCAAHMCFSVLVAVLLWYTTARFECLAMEFQKSSNVDMMVICVKKQLRLMRYADKLAATVRYIILSVIAGSTCILILCGMVLIVNAPIIVKAQFIAITITMLVEVYMYTWPADYMKDMSENFSRSAYDITWYKQSLRMQKDLLHVLVYQKPVVISISCVMPELTLEYYCSYLSNSFSIFTGLRAMIASN